MDLKSKFYGGRLGERLGSMSERTLPMMKTRIPIRAVKRVPVANIYEKGIRSTYISADDEKELLKISSSSQK